MLSEYWICRGKVTNPDCYDPAFGPVPKIGDDEWQFSDTHPDNRGMSYDFLTVEAGLAALAPAVFHWVG